MTLSEELASLLKTARGKRSRRAIARERGKADTPLLDLERGRANPTLRRLEEEIGPAYGVRFHLVAKPLPKRRRNDDG